MMKIYNTLTREIEEFVPIRKDRITMYVCGPTVYNYIHIGNARSVVAFDVIRKYLEYRGYKVDFVMNFTNVDDKIINRAHEENLTPAEVSEKYIAAFYEDTNALNVKLATENPRATDYIDQMLDFIKLLIEKGFAYESAGDVYFRVAKSEGYGKLANKNLAELLEGASGRTDKETERKESPADFALWKSAKAGEISWQSPWGDGRPGWHIECSVMSTSLLGDTIDIHGGGADLEFPHHTNEIAQSEAKTGKKFANYWLHNGFVNVDGEKMSKSLGNFKTVHEMLESKNGWYDSIPLEIAKGNLIRFFLATTHYRRPINFCDDTIELAWNNLYKIWQSSNILNHEIEVQKNNPSVESTSNGYLSDYGLPEVFIKTGSSYEVADANVNITEEFKKKFNQEMDADFQIQNALTVFYNFLSWSNSSRYQDLAEKRKFFDEVLTIIGIKFKQSEDDPEIDALVKEYDLVRADKNFVRADQIRADLRAQGIILETTKEGTWWRHEK